MHLRKDIDAALCDEGKTDCRTQRFERYPGATMETTPTS